MAKDVKKDENTGKIKISNSRVNENAIDMTDKVEDDGENDGVTIEAQQRKSDAFMATMMATLAEMTGAADTKKGIKEKTEKEKKEEREELCRKEEEKERNCTGKIKRKKKERNCSGKN